MQLYLVALCQVVLSATISGGTVPSSATISGGTVPGSATISGGTVHSNYYKRVRRPVIIRRKPLCKHLKTYGKSLEGFQILKTH